MARSLLTLRSTDPAGQGAVLVGTGRRSESVIRTPLLAGDRVLGLISVQSYTPDLYDDQDIEVLEAMAALAATAILSIEYLAQREELEAQLRQAQKMEAVGRLAAGVAHDFNNLLTAILGNTGLMLAALADDDPLRLDLEEVEAAAERAAGLTRQLLAFGRQQLLLPRELHLNGQVEQVRGLLLRLGSVFEPFFSTKPAGQGTGLGLATVHGIVQQSGGCVHAASTPGEGSTFTIYLPRIAAAPDRPAARPLPEPPIPSTETVLLVEDEPAVRHLARRILERQGYRVIEAGDGEAALQLLAEQPIRVDLLLTDVMMPRMGGPALAANLRSSHASLNVLFMSGYAGDILGGHGALTDPDSFIPKPFTPQALSAAVRTALDGPAR